MDQPPRRYIYGTEADYQAAWPIRNGNSSRAMRDEMGVLVRGIREPTRIPIGSQFGDLTVIGYERKTVEDKAWGWLPVCRCGLCGAENAVLSYNLKKGRSTRCNVCAKIASNVYRKGYWGYASIIPDEAHRRRLLNRIAAIYQRCENPSAKWFKHYGERGIAVGFPDRRAFLAHLVTLQGWDQPELELDRVDNDKGYSPGNLKFSTKSENASNRRDITTLTRRIAELEACLRHCTCGAAQSLHRLD
jgi:hypothetical protein